MKKKVLLAVLSLVFVITLSNFPPDVTQKPGHIIQYSEVEPGL
ncbi:hypothetical protein [Paenibacillus ehimensis]|nr:hypothetical protein [Paenibacillus ehimensis]